MHKLKLLTIVSLALNANHLTANDNAKMLSLLIVPTLKLMQGIANTTTTPIITFDQVNDKVSEDVELYVPTSCTLEAPTPKKYPTSTKPKFKSCIPEIHRSKRDPRRMGMTGARQNYNFRK